MGQDSHALVSDGAMDALKNAVSEFSTDQLLWSSGYLAGLAARPVQPLAPDASTQTAVEWTVLYATETGNSRSVAESLARDAAARGVAVVLEDLADFRPKRLKSLRHALFVVSTHGVGDAPEGSEMFFDFWFGPKAPRLDDLVYSVLALGDSSYVDFCEIGRRLDARLEELGARRVTPRTDCDLDFEEPSARWTEAVLEHAESKFQRSAREPGPRLVALPTAHRYSKTHPFDAAVLANQRITDSGSDKDVRHIELDLSESGLRYEPGDVLGVLPVNPEPLVDAVITASGLDGDADVSLGGEMFTLHDALRHKLEITKLSRPALDVFAKGDSKLSWLDDRADDRDRLSAFVESNQLIDVLHDYPVSLDAQAFVDALRRLPPRSYSIASCPDTNEDEVHLTVAVVDYIERGRRHWGAASSYLASEAESVQVFVEANPRFRLPEDGNTPIVMVGAGTGIAPYRAFVEHRRQHAHTGRNWLIFGDRTFRNDFLYQLEWLRYRKDGLLTRIDTAFSRDQAEKIYVQHRMLEQAEELYGWLEEGAHFYVCGDAKRMAGDVDAALHQVVERARRRGADDASDYVAALREQGRYKKDVY